MVTGAAFSEPCRKVKKYMETDLLHIVVFFSVTPYSLANISEALITSVFMTDGGHIVKISSLV